LTRKKKPEEGGGGSPAWMATFSDLMNLLLCFFVLLFSMSSIDAEKFEEIAASLQASFSIFDGGATSITEGNLISSGVSQLNELNDYYTNMGTNQDEDTEMSQESIHAYEEYKEEQMKEESEQLSENLEQQLENQGLMSTGDVDIDFTTQYVSMNLNGALLFDSGEANIKDEAATFMRKMGEVLKNYSDYDIQIIGHTDTVPMAGGSKYSDNMELSQGRAYSVFKYLIDNKGMSPTNMECIGRGEYEPIASNDTAEGRAQNRRVEIRIYNETSSQN
jgi:chemotaxis protein MotB